MYSGEIDGLKRFAPDIELHISGEGFYKKTGDPKIHAAHRQKAQNALVLAKEKMASGHFDILILDEINNALKLKLVDLAQVIEMIDVKPPLMHLILTGRDVHPAVVRRAHIVTDMQELKHAYREGIAPQKGIDY
jgi:cob(I)alamin adenosyltransferase